MFRLPRAAEGKPISAAAYNAAMAQIEVLFNSNGPDLFVDPSTGIHLRRRVTPRDTVLFQLRHGIPGAGGFYAASIAEGYASAAPISRLTMPAELQVPIDPNAVVMNTAEWGLNKHLLSSPEGAEYYNAFLTGRVVGSVPQEPTNNYAGFPLVQIHIERRLIVFPVLTLRDGGSNGTNTTMTSYTYTIYHLFNTNTPLGTGLTPTMPRPLIGAVRAQTGYGYGTAYFKADGDVVLLDAQEVPGREWCT